jgi:multiple sugar transport system ATP-binding protein
MNFIHGEVDAYGFFRAGALNVKLRQAMPQRAILGVRPEHIRIEAGGALTGTATLVEPMGNHQVVWLDCAGQNLSCIVQEPRVFAPGQTVSFQIDAARVSLFDPDSGKALSYALEQSAAAPHGALSMES